MKKHLWQIMALLAALLISSSAFAQSKGGNLVVDVPFSFTIADHTFPAGRYTVQHMGDPVLRIVGADSQSALVMTNRVERSAQDSSRKMVFHRYDHVYFLSEVWDAPVSIGRKVPRSRAEKKLEETGDERKIAMLLIP
jgi:hypothetical protein